MRGAGASCFAQAAAAARSLRFAAVPNPHGSAKLSISRYRGPRLLVQAPTCTASVSVGHVYRASLDYRTTSRAAVLVALAHGGRGWKVWYAAVKHLQLGRSTPLSLTLEPIPSGVDRITVGIELRGRGTVQLGRVSLVDVTQRSTSASSTGAPAGSGGTVSTPLGGKPEGAPTHEEEAHKREEEEMRKRREEEEREKEAAKRAAEAEIARVKEEEAHGEYDKVGQWEVLPGFGEGARTVHTVLLQNGRLLLMAGSGNNRTFALEKRWYSYVYDPLTKAAKEIPTPYDLFCAGHVQLSNGNVLILGGTKEYPPEPGPGEFPSTVYKGENQSYIFNVKEEKYEPVNWNKSEPHNAGEPGPLLNGAWYPSATELGNGNVISFGGLNEEGKGATQTNYFIAPGNPSDVFGDEPGEWVGYGSTLVQQTYSWQWGLYPAMILTADGRLFYSGSHVFGNGLDKIESETTPGTYYKGENAPEGSSLYDYECRVGESGMEPHANAELGLSWTGEKGEARNKTVKRVESTPGLREPDRRDQSAALLLPPAQEQKVMILGGGNTYETEGSAINLTDEINLKEEHPHWIVGPNLPAGAVEEAGEPMEPMSAGKMYVSAVALPDETVLETGGSLRPRTANVHEASIFNPKTNTFTRIAWDPVGRDYHSEAVLLPSGEVMTLGSNPVTPEGEKFETRISLFKPPYLFKGERPQIETIDGTKDKLNGNFNETPQWDYGTSHKLTYSTPTEIAKAVLIRPAAVTHSSDPNQREIQLPIAGGHGAAGGKQQLEVGLTSNDNIAPPGYYMLFIDNAAGVPSVAQWVHVGPQS